jgi:hypothetical protein
MPKTGSEEVLTPEEA